MRSPKLAADLAELARPVGEHQGAASVLKKGDVVETLGTVEASSSEPSARKLIIARNIVSEGSRYGVWLRDPAPDELAAPHERMINRAAQGFPADRGVDSIELIDHVRSDSGVPARVRCTQI